MQCTNQQKQIALAAHNHESAQKVLPAALRGEVPKGYTFPSGAFLQVPYVWSWSALAMLTPFLEETSIFDMMDLQQPLFDSSSHQFTIANREAVGTMIKSFLCPSDSQQPATASVYSVVNPDSTTYVFCAGTGEAYGSAPLGSLWNTNGPFMAGRKFSLSAITDGTSNTVMLSESTLGTSTEGTSTNPNDHRTNYAYAGSVATLTESASESATQWNVDYRRGYSWTAGEYRCASYNHFYTPNRYC